jgi:hypothetical protein
MQLPCGAAATPAAAFAARLAGPGCPMPQTSYRRGLGAAPANGFAPWPTVPIVQNDNQQARRPTGSSQGQRQRALGGGAAMFLVKSVLSVWKACGDQAVCLFLGADNVVRECQ